MKNKYYLGLDIGSISINTVLLDEEKRIIENHYDFCHGKPFHLLKNILTSVFSRYPENSIETIAFTGTGGKVAKEILGGHFVN